MCGIIPMAMKGKLTPRSYMAMALGGAAGLAAERATRKKGKADTAQPGSPATQAFYGSSGLGG